MASYKVLVGLDYGDKRVEAGDVISDLPTKSVSWLKEQGLIEEITTTSKTTSKSTKVDEQVEEEAQ
jgi:hypothetical protein